LYTAALLTIDELAERILSLGKPPYSTFKDYIETAQIKEIQTIGLKDTLMVKAIIDDLAALIAKEREILDITAKAGDDGTNDMVNRFMQFNEKNTWMLRSFVNED
jgi:starvation-inducible DNA-binding protein